MRRKQKRLLQFAGLFIVALLFLPNVGLWSLYRDRVFDNSPDIPGDTLLIQVGTRPRRLPRRFVDRPAVKPRRRLLFASAAQKGHSAGGAC